MKIVFIGSTVFGLRCLQEVLDLKECNVVGVVTAPSEFSISYSEDKVKNVLYSDFPSFCINRDIPVEEIGNGMNNTQLFEKMREWQPDIFVVVGWYHMIPKSWRKLCPAYALHASLLPDYSGGAPLVWAMINGEKKTGITLFQMDDAVDSGPILGQAEELIGADDTIATLYSRIEEAGIKLLKDGLPVLVYGRQTLKYQDEYRRRIFPQRSPKDGLINLEWSCRDIYNFIRAQTKPYPGAFLMSQNATEKIIIWVCRVHSLRHKQRVGSSIEIQGHSGICCSDGVIVPLLVDYRGSQVDYEAKQYTSVVG